MTPPRGRRLTRPQARAVLAAGVAILLGFLTELELLAPVVLTAALVAPGYAIVAELAAALEDDVDAWIVWTLRVVVSVATWTVLGTVLVEAHLDPRRSGIVVGIGLVTAAVLALRSSAASSEPGTAGGRVRWPAPSRRQAAVVAASAVVFSASIGGAVAVSQAGVVPPQYVALALDPTELGGAGLTGTGAGPVEGRLLVRNGSAQAQTLRLSVVVDGTRRWTGKVVLAVGGTARVPFTIRTTACWQHLQVTVTGVPASLQPRALTASGPVGCRR